MTTCHRAWQIQTGQTDWSAVKVDCVLSEERDLQKTNKTTHLHHQPAIDKGDAKQRTSIRFGLGPLTAPNEPLFVSSRHTQPTPSLFLKVDWKWVCTKGVNCIEECVKHSVFNSSDDYVYYVVVFRMDLPAKSLVLEHALSCLLHGCDCPFPLILCGYLPVSTQAFSTFYHAGVLEQI